MHLLFLSDRDFDNSYMAIVTHMNEHQFASSFVLLLAFSINAWAEKHGWNRVVCVALKIEHGACNTKVMVWIPLL